MSRVAAVAASVLGCDRYSYNTCRDPNLKAVRDQRTTAARWRQDVLGAIRDPIEKLLEKVPLAVTQGAGFVQKMHVAQLPLPEPLYYRIGWHRR